MSDFIKQNDVNDPNNSKIRFVKESNNKSKPICKDYINLSDLESLVGKEVSVYWCKNGVKRNTKKEESDHFMDQIFDGLENENRIRPDRDFKTPTQVCVKGKLEQFPNDPEHFRVLVDDLNYSYFDLKDIFQLVVRKTYTSCICLNWK